MVTVHELYSLELPNLSTLADSCDPETTQALLAGEGGSSGAAGGRFEALVQQPRPFLGPTPALVSVPTEVLDAQLDSIRSARERANDNLRFALQRRAHSRLASTQEQSRFACDSELAPEDFVPAVFPFPEPIPAGPPSRSTCSQRASAAGNNSRASSRMTAWSPSPSRWADMSITKEDLQYVPAVFPFPEPIPRGPPTRTTPMQVWANSSSSSRATPRAASVASSRPADIGRVSPSISSTAPTPVSARRSVFTPSHQSRCSQHSRQSQYSVAPSGLTSSMQPPTGRSLKATTCDPGFIEDHRSRADAWISECVPKSYMCEQPLPMWLQLKRDAERQRKTREKMFQNLPTMPFDLWFEMKKAAQAEEADEAGEVDLRRHYQSVGQHRRGRHAHGGRKHTFKHATAAGTNSRHSRRSRRFGMHDEYNERNESGSPTLDDSAD